MTYAPSIIDLSRATFPDALQTLDYEVLQQGFIDRFIASWNALRAKYPDLPDYDVQILETDPVMIASQAWTYLRIMDRQRINDAVKAVLPVYASGSDLDAVVADNNVERLVIQPADRDQPAVMESDERLLYRYLHSFDGRSAGSSKRYIYEAMTALPTLEVGGVSVLGWRVHGRRGDVDIIVCGPGGRTLGAAEMATLREACLADHVVPEATSAMVLEATRHEYQVTQTVTVPAGPSPALVQAEIARRVRVVTDAATIIGGKVVRDFVAGAARGESVMDAVTHTPEQDIDPDPYTVPVCTSVLIDAETAR